ncbi:MAG TPA: DUF4058 family protein [Gemmataceae bacterium]|nr:DUF4058 family protein [Gemmataceae bacterium]
MPSPFPGMDPYLEDPELWPDVHHELISQIRSALNPVLRPRYVARVELRIYVSSEDDPARDAWRVPDARIERTKKRKGSKTTKRAEALAIAEPLNIPFLVEDEIQEAYLEIRHIESKTTVTVIEVISPSNKIRGSAGRESFLSKRRNILASKVHWVEIDLLRAGTPSLDRLAVAASDYRIVVSRGEDWRRARFWPVNVRQALPVIGVPLRGKDPDAPLDLNAVLCTAYDKAEYDATIDYRRDPLPPLSREDALWAARLLSGHGLR